MTQGGGNYLISNLEQIFLIGDKQNTLRNPKGTFRFRKEQSAWR